MSAREVGRISHMHGDWDITIRELRSLLGRRRFYEIACDCSSTAMAGTSSSDEAWEWAYDHSNWHAQRSAEGAHINEEQT